MSHNLQKSKVKVESRGRAAGLDFGATHEFLEVALTSVQHLMGKVWHLGRCQAMAP